MAAGMVFNPDGMLVVDILVQPPALRKRQDKYTMEGTIRTCKQDLTNWSRRQDFYNFIKMCGECLAVEMGPQLSLGISVLFLITFGKYL